MLIDNTRNAPSLISREASTAIKGLMMLLIVFGHTGMLTTDFATGSKTFFYRFLYSFHVYIFLILPIIYGYQPKQSLKKRNNDFLIDFHQVLDDLKRSVKRIGVPYCWFFLFSAIVFVTVGGGAFNLPGMMYAFIFGNEPLLDRFIGFNFIWFLPAMLSLLTLKSIYFNSCKQIKLTIVVISIALWVLSIFKVTSLNSIGMFVPFAISQAFFFIILGLASRFIVEKEWPNYYVLPTCFLLIVFLTVLLYSYYGHVFFLSGISLDTAIRLFMPILVFTLLYGFRNILARSTVLKLIGSYSLQIYLIHVFVINALELVFTHYLGQNVYLGALVYLLSLGISLFLAIVMVKVPTLRKILFPR